MRLFIRILVLFTLFIPISFAASYTLDQVLQHNTVEDCWMVIEGKVYNVTSYINQHPGGVDSIVSGCGKDATDTFAQIHSPRAYDLLTGFGVGDLSATIMVQTNNNDTIRVINNLNSATPIQDGSVTPIKKPFIQLSVLDQYPFIIPVTFIWLFLYCGHAILRKKWPKKFMRLGVLRMTSFIMFISFIGVGGGGLVMLFNGPGGELFGFRNTMIHAFFGYIFILMAISHIIIHWRDLWGYLKKAFMKRKILS